MNNAQIVSEVKLDELDISLIKQLEVDARQSGPELAKTLGSSPTTIRRRLQWLLDQNVISIVAIPDPLALGFKIRALLAVNTRPGTLAEVAESIKPNKNVRVIIATTGRYDMLLSVAFQSSRQLLRFMDDELGRHPNVTDIEAMRVLKVVKSSWMRVGSEEPLPAHKNPPGNLDDSELMLIKELEINPRASITDLAKRLSISRISIRRRLQTLMENKTIHVVSVANLAAFGIQTRASILVKAKPGQISNVASALAADDRIYHVAMINGRFNVTAIAGFRDSGEMSNFLVNDLGKIPGLMHHETLIHVGAPKQSFELLSHDVDS